MGKLEVAEVLKYSLIGLGFAMSWGTSQNRLNNLEKMTEPITEMRTDIEVVKEAILQIRDAIKEEGRARRMERTR